MADSAHLEEMGRELKCPICLSLLNSTASLSCNHMFCNSCIVTSMKSDSHCPVCKVPYRRREIRPAPHMDNLVNIYKSMEVASGLNIFITQTTPVTNVSDKQGQVEHDGNFGRQEAGGKSLRKSKRQKISKRKGSKEPVEANAEDSDSNPSVRPSFPAKKRVHVPQCLQDETPMRTERCIEEESRKNSENGQNDGSTILKEKPSSNDKEETVFEPFFWLRDEDDNDENERSSGQHMEVDRVTDSPTPKLPSFSDIRDSDDESPTKVTTSGGVHLEAMAADIFDSEMFEWTQRPCSPELFSTPAKTKARYQEVEGIEEEEYQTASQNIAATNSEGVISENINCQQVDESTEKKLLTPLKAKNTKAQKGRRKSKKTSRRTIGRAKGKCVQTSPEEIHVGSSKTDEALNAGNCAANGTAPSLGKKYYKRNKKASFDSIEGDKVADSTIEVKNQNQGNEETRTELPILLDKDPENGQNIVPNHKSSKNYSANGTAPSLGKKYYKRNKRASFDSIDGDKVADSTIEVIQGNDEARTELPILLDKDPETETQFQIKYQRNLKRLTVNDAMVNVLVPLIQNQENKNENLEPPPLSYLKADGRTSDVGVKTCKTAKNANILAQRNCAGESREMKRMKISDDDNVKSRLVEEVLGGSSKSSTKETQNTTPLLQENFEIKAVDNSKNTKKFPSLSKDTFLKKCGSRPVQTQCAFCQSSTESEASGEMLHYYNGKPVSADYNGGSTLIHSHSSCTEWAPNVYFEDEIAVNLETEIARSRRIKCSCCGLKGAALGCFVKNCHKSFHVPCAKLVAECRWDTENFVMLCPLHFFSKLPKEILGSQGQRRKKSIPKGEPAHKQPEVVTEHGTGTSRQWKCLGSSSLWVLCCSGLTIAEKEIVSEFSKVTGVSVSKTFGPSVTHIIASTDENGACKRTLKFLMGILEGKWILRIEWIKACMKAMESVAEKQYEVRVDVHGIKDGPRLGRLRIMNKQPKLFSGLKFYFSGEFVPSYKGDLQDLVVAAGGTILHRKPVTGDQGISSFSGSSRSTTIIIYSVEIPDKCDPDQMNEICNHRQDVAKALASSTGSQIAPHSWLLDSIAACKLQKLT